MSRIHAFPDLVRREAIAALLVGAGLCLLSALADAPLGGPAAESVPMTSGLKAPWIFVGIQKSLLYLPVQVGGILFPLAAVGALAMIPFVPIRFTGMVRLLFAVGILVPVVVTAWGYWS